MEMKELIGNILAGGGKEGCFARKECCRHELPLPPPQHVLAGKRVTVLAPTPISYCYCYDTAATTTDDDELIPLK